MNATSRRRARSFSPSPQADLFAAPNVLPEGFCDRPNVISRDDDEAPARELADLRLRSFEFHGYLANRQVVSFGLLLDSTTVALSSPTLRRFHRFWSLVRSGRTPEELAREFEPTAQSISTWVKQAERDAGKRSDGPTSVEREELGRLRRENHRLRQERDILAKAAAWFARESKASPNGFTGS